VVPSRAFYACAALRGCGIAQGVLVKIWRFGVPCESSHSHYIRFAVDECLHVLICFIGFLRVQERDIVNRPLFQVQKC